jgi:hypothetical protein
MGAGHRRHARRAVAIQRHLSRQRRGGGDPALRQWPQRLCHRAELRGADRRLRSGLRPVGAAGPERQWHGNNADRNQRRRPGRARWPDRAGDLSLRRPGLARRHLCAAAGQICHAPRRLSGGGEHRLQ